MSVRFSDWSWWISLSFKSMYFFTFQYSNLHLIGKKYVITSVWYMSFQSIHIENQVWNTGKYSYLNKWLKSFDV